MDKIYFGICEYCDEPAAMIISGKVFDMDGIMTEYPLDEVNQKLLTIPIEYIDDSLYGYYDGTMEELKEDLERLGFIHNDKVEEEAIASFNVF